MREVLAGGLGEAVEEFLDRRGRAVAALEIEVHAAAKASSPISVLSMRTSSAPFS
jgi:hypothetical protein